MSDRRVGVVTGAASGIGRAVALRLDQEGAHVIAVDRDEHGLGTLRGGAIEPFVADLSSSAARDELVARVARPDFLVNAAGIIIVKPILDLTMDDIRAVYSVNVEAVWDLTSRIGRTMPAGGAIANVSSAAAKVPATAEIAAYAMSKAAVLSLTRSFAVAFAARGVRVNAVCPAVIATPMQDRVEEGLAKARDASVEDIREARLKPIPMARMGTPEECAAVVWFLLSTESAYMTGQAINVTGGWVTW